MWLEAIASTVHGAQLDRGEWGNILILGKRSWTVITYNLCKEKHFS